MKVDVLLGLQWGDEGKGKIVDYLAPNYKVVARFQGGPNAGHTLKINGQKFVLHTIPSGIFHGHIMNLIGNGVVLDPVTFRREVEHLESLGLQLQHNLLLSLRANLILPTHRLLDAASEAAKGKDKIGSTLKGIGPAYMDKTGRNGLRIGDVLAPDFDRRYRALKEKHLRLLDAFKPEADLGTMEKEWMEGLETLRRLPCVNAEYYLHEALNKGHRVLAEGAQGSMLDIDFGTYPFVTSSNTISAAACTGLGVAPSRIGHVLGITKAYCTRVGGGPFPTELHDETGERMRKEGQEFGATTGRPRRCGWLDLPALRYTMMLNGVDQLIVTKADVLNIFEDIQVCTSYRIQGKEQQELPFDLCREEVEPVYTRLPGWGGNYPRSGKKAGLPAALQEYMLFLEKQTGVAVTMLSVGPEREQLIELVAAASTAV